MVYKFAWDWHVSTRGRRERQFNLDGCPNATGNVAQKIDVFVRNSVVDDLNWQCTETQCNDKLNRVSLVPMRVRMRRETVYYH